MVFGAEMQAVGAWAWQPWGRGYCARVRRRAPQRGWCPCGAGHGPEDWSRCLMPALCPPVRPPEEALGESRSRALLPGKCAGSCSWGGWAAAGQKGADVPRAPPPCQAGLVAAWVARLPGGWHGELLNRSRSVQLWDPSKGLRWRLNLKGWRGGRAPGPALRPSLPTSSPDPGGNQAILWDKNRSPAPPTAKGTEA